MTSRALESSPQTYARIGAILYLFIIVAGLFGEVFVRGGPFTTGHGVSMFDSIRKGRARVIYKRR